MRSLVPLRAKTTDGPGAEGVLWANIPGVSTRANNDMQGRIIQNETDGLESGELAWILGRRYGGSGISSDPSASAHGLGMGYGVDRMQRLAYTSWVEAFFRASHGAVTIRLDLLAIASPFARSQSAEIRSHAALLAGRSVLESVDVPHVINNTFSQGTGPTDPYTYVSDVAAHAADPTQGVIDAPPGVNGGLSCGIFVMEEGPFLRGKTVEDRPVSMVAPDLMNDGNGKQISHTAPRNLGDELAFEALYAEMRRLAMFNWTPDGMVLSKLESPSGDPLSSSEMDARQAQLFNIAIQGPAIAKTWTGDPLQQTMPMDRVFMCVVATVQSTLAGKATAYSNTGAEAYKRLIDAMIGRDEEEEKNARADLETLIKTGSSMAADDGEIGKFARDMQEQFKEAGVTANGYAASKGTLGPDANKTFETLNKSAWRLKAAQVRTGELGVTNSTMSNFRLMRATSSYLAQYSRWKVADGKLDAKSRCGLRMGLAGNTATAEYIVGAWCIGTVVDNAASRSTVGHLVRIAPASMAINISVNVEWWSGDKLYRHYMDTDSAIESGSTVQTRSERTGKKSEELRAAGLEVPLADISEPASWAWKI